MDRIHFTAHSAAHLASSKLVTLAAAVVAAAAVAAAANICADIRITHLY
jgi:hypothetical protein